MEAQSEGLVTKRCPLCNFHSPTVALLLSHLRSVHASEPRFNVTCGIGGCAVSSRSFSALYSHVYRRHPNEGIIKKGSSVSLLSQEQPLIAESMASPQSDSDSSFTLPDDHAAGLVEADVAHMLGRDTVARRRASALFLLKLKEHRRVTQAAVDDVVEDCQSIIQQTVTTLHSGVRSCLAKHGLDPDSVKGLEDVFLKYSDPFLGLESKHLQEEYYKKDLGLLEPIAIKVGEPYHVKQFFGTKLRLQEKFDTFQYVPLFDTLKKLLGDPTILEEIELCPNRVHTDGKIEDFCDGSRFREHPLFSQDPYGLQIIAYYDEVEMCNPLGSHVKKHKLGIVFFTLGNIHPKYRSSLRVINLVLVATVPVIERQGIDKILQPFISDLNKLSTSGIEVTVNGSKRVFRGALLAFLADNLASNFLGGFKLSFSFSFRSCRTCLATHSNLSSSFFSDSFCSRNDENYEEQCALVDGPLKEHFSKVYGINNKSCLVNVSNFSLFGGGLPHDAMHDIMEGIAPLEIKLLLLSCIQKKYFTLAEYNSKLLNFSYGYTESDKPIPILSRVLNGDGSLRSTASQMLLLIRILPFIIGPVIPENDKNWKCFLLLRETVDIVLCPIVTESMSVSLKSLIDEHHSLFFELYKKYIPKHHLITHYPEQMLTVGPLTKSWTIRHEAKLNFFKQAARLDNFKNIAFSMANRHQRWACYEFSDGHLLSRPLECGPGKNPLRVCDQPVNIQEGLKKLVNVSPHATVFYPQWVRKDGIKYQDNVFLITGSDGLDPVFVQLDELLVIGGDMVIFIVKPCTTLYFDSHYHAYAVEVQSQRILVAKLSDHNVLHGRKVNHTLYVGLKYFFLP